MYICNSHVCTGKEGLPLENMTLDRLKEGQRATVSALLAPAGEQLRLLELGFVPGRAVAALQAAPWGDPVAYAVCGSVIALRRADAQRIIVQ